MEIRRFLCNPFRENAFLLGDERSKMAVLVDPGFYSEMEFSRLLSFVRSNNYSISRVLNTHLHLDHCIGNGFVRSALKIEAECGLKDLPLLEHSEEQSLMFGLEIACPIPVPGNFLKENDEIDVGDIHLKVLEVPGHSPGSIAFYSAEGFVFAGDVVFAGGGYGRTDLPGGNEKILMDSIHRKLFQLPKDTRIFCGHGPDTTVGREIAVWEARKNSGF